MVIQGELVGLYVYKGHTKAPSTSTVTLVGPVIPGGCYCVIESASVIDYTTANKQMILGIRDGAGNDTYTHQVKNTNIYQVQMNGQTILRENEAIIGLVLSPTASDEIYANAFGFIYRMAE